MVKPVEQRWLDDCQACNLQRVILYIQTEVSVTGHFRRRAEENCELLTLAIRARIAGKQK